MSEITNDGRRLANATIHSLINAAEGDLQLAFGIAQIAGCHMLANLCINVDAIGGDSLEEAKKKVIARFEQELEFMIKERDSGGGFTRSYPAPKNSDSVN